MEMKLNLTCPNCSFDNAKIKSNLLGKAYYECPNCNWNSLIDTADIAYSNNATAALSNLFPHKFYIDNVTCLSMESFIQSLREKNPLVQLQICSNYSGMMAYKMRLCLRDWRKDGYVYWKGKRIKRDSDEYTDLITKAYDNLYTHNIVFQTILKSFKGMYLIHSIGNDDKAETLLTEKEYRYQLNRLLEKYC